eukprot:TRINITY_DN1741_c0_g1_i1.p1 TRINITY_DN1741_c0_g1~~TRINITY_DN1741_c0_g1_i1.p1  ORF type:complete len:320 (-),score=40.60 TRINITY_DN1741_c0_g1_i1:39-998(-)
MDLFRFLFHKVQRINFWVRLITFRFAVNLFGRARNYFYLYEHIHKVENRKIQIYGDRNGEKTNDTVSLPVRIYHPRESKNLQPVLVYFHGGGFSICSVNTHDAICRHIAKKANCIVVSVDYRLSPEHKFPIPLEDCYEAAKWCVQHATEFGGNPNKIGVGGDSAGGTAAAVIPQLSILQKGPKFHFQVLIYPSIDRRGVIDYPSLKFKGDDMLNSESLLWFSQQYMNNMEVEKFDHRVSPIVFNDLSALPQALVVTTKSDIMRDEAEVYAKMLQNAGVKSTLKRIEIDEVGHGFFVIAKYSTFVHGINVICDWLNDILA